MTSVIINPVAVEDFRSRVEGRVVVEGAGRERGAMNSSGSGSGGEGGGKFIVPGLFCFLPFYYLSVISRWFRGEQGEPGRAAHPKFNADLGEEEQEEEQPVHPLRQGQGEVRGEETWRGSWHQVSLSHPLIMRRVKVCRDLRNVRVVSCVVIR